MYTIPSMHWTTTQRRPRKAVDGMGLWSCGEHQKPVARPRNPEINLLGSILVHCLDRKFKGNLIPLRLVGSFFDFIPARLGHNTALDDAVSCLCAIYHGISSVLYNIDKGVYRSYVKSLSSLRGCIGDDSTWMNSETLCASILLQLCEVSFL